MDDMAPKLEPITGKPMEDDEPKKVEAQTPTDEGRTDGR